jgi:hypothetical protein
MGEEKDIGWGACFVSNPFKHGNGNCAQLCKKRAGLEIDQSVTNCHPNRMQAAVKAIGGGEWVLRRCSRSHRATVGLRVSLVLPDCNKKNVRLRACLVSSY